MGYGGRGYVFGVPFRIHGTRARVHLPNVRAMLRIEGCVADASFRFQSVTWRMMGIQTLVTIEDSLMHGMGTLYFPGFRVC